MSNLLQDNILFLYKHHNTLFMQLQDFLNNNEEKLSHIIDSSNIVNISYLCHGNKVLLYNEDSDELNDWKNEYAYSLNDGVHDVILFGLGLSHHLTKLIELNRDLNFYIIEPNIDIFVETLKVINIEQFFSHPQIKLFHLGNTEEEFKTFHYLVNTYSSNSVVDVFVPFYASINLQEMKLFYKLAYKARENQLIATAFESTFGTLPYKNSIRNIEKVYKSNSVKLLKNQYKGCAALIVGAGPSLEVDIDFIRKNQEKVLIIAAGSSIQSLLHYNIRPHLIVSMDPSQANGRVFEQNDLTNIPLLFIPQIFSNILEIHSENNFFAFFNNDCIINYLYSDIEIDYYFRGNNSVSGTAVQVARYLGAETILFAGQDLSYPNKKYYSKGAKHLDNGQLAAVVQSSNLSVENVTGGMNTTNLSMISALEDTEQLIQELSDIKFINTSSLGAQIKGADFMAIEDAFNIISDIQYNFNNIAEQAKIKKTTFELELNEMQNRVNLVVSDCDYLVELCNYCIRSIGKFEEYSRTQPNKAMTTLLKLENKFSLVTEHRLYIMIIPIWIRGKTSQYDKNVGKIEKENNLINKSKLLNEIVIPYIEEIIKSLNDIKQEFTDLQSKLLEN